MMNKFSIIITLLIMFFYPIKEVFSLDTKEYIGEVKYVIDGDTLILKDTNLKLRLWGVDAPEINHNGGFISRNSLVKMVKGKKITFIKINDDKYGRVVARIFVNNREINRAMIENGYAKEYCWFSKGFY